MVGKFGFVNVIWIGLGITALFCTANVASESDFSMPSYDIRSLCGTHINLKWKKIYTAELKLSSSNGTSPSPPSLASPPYAPRDPCDVTVESWDFLNRLMIRFAHFRSDRNCSETSLALYDGLTNGVTLEGLPRRICGHHRNIIMSRSFVTSDKFLMMRIPGSSLVDNSLELKLYITAFQKGKCKSYEYPCANGRCIMGELACNGYNPCGDNSDCPLPIPQEVEEDSHPVFLAAIIALSVSVVAVIIGAIVLYRCYRMRRKRRRQEFRDTADVQESQPMRNEDRHANYQRSESQIEADRRFAPPSYNSLPVHTEQSNEDAAAIETIDEDGFNNDDGDEYEGGENGSCKDIEFYDRNNPPAYKCVMEHKEMFNVSLDDIHNDPKKDNT